MTFRDRWFRHTLDRPGPSGETYAMFLSGRYAGPGDPMQHYYRCYPYMAGWI
jgi:hypothetical protein